VLEVSKRVPISKENFGRTKEKKHSTGVLMMKEHLFYAEEVLHRLHARLALFPFHFRISLGSGAWYRTSYSAQVMF
jgi:hypothetical protein